MAVAAGCFALVLSPVRAQADQPAAAPMVVMTYNLRYASQTGPNAWPKRRPVAKALIQSVHPDLIGTQEGLYEQLKDLSADLPQYAWIGLGRDGGSRGEFMAVFYRTQRFEPLAFDHFWLSETPDRIASSSWNSACRRMVTWVEFLDRSSGQRFYFFNTHFDHRSQLARQQSAKLLWQRVEQLRTREPVILVGDFNAAAGHSQVYQTLVAPARFRDAWIEAPEKGRAIGTFHGFGGPAQASPQRIDWILVRGPVEVERAEVVTFSQNGQYPSDHFPVVARLKLGK